jgi:hypothetical protein
MSRTPDRRPGESDEEGVVFEDVGADPVVIGGVRFNAGNFRMMDQVGVFNPRGTDEKAKVSANDTTAGYLNGKLVAGPNIILTELNNGSNESLQIEASPTALPTGYVQATADGNASTTSELFQVAVTLTTGALEAGEYLVMWYAEISTTVSNKRYEVEFRNDVTQYGAVQERVSDNLFYNSFAGHRHLVLGAGVQTFDLRYRCIGPTTTATIRRARIVLWRVL